MDIRSTRSSLSGLILASALLATSGQTAVAQPATSTGSQPAAEITGAAPAATATVSLANPIADALALAAEAEAAEAAAEAAAEKRASPCGTGAAKDDGSVETGYGYVPNAKYGRYIQEFRSDEFPSAEMQQVCVCWLRSKDDDSLDFNVVFYKDENGRPAAAPYATVASTATEVPYGISGAGRFYQVDVTGVTLAEGISYIGVDWDPSASTIFYICVDRSPETERVNTFSMEDRSPRWTEVGSSPDPIFRPHRALLVRAVAAPAEAAPAEDP